MKILCFLCYFLLLSEFAFGQATITNNQTTIHSNRVWFSYFGQYKFSSNWGLHTDVQFRMDDEVKQATQNLMRAGLVRYLSPAINLTAGYAYINTQGALQTWAGPFNFYATEHRTWEQFIYNHTLRPLTSMTHRLRLEQRLAEKYRVAPNDAVLSEYVYGNRIRYFNRTLFEWKKPEETRPNFYVALQNEIFINVAAPDLNPNTFDQNRFLIAFGVFHKKQTRLELGYMNQFIYRKPQQNALNHILHVSVLQNLNFMTTTE